jgi:hypothetical protein
MLTWEETQDDDENPNYEAVSAITERCAYTVKYRITPCLARGTIVWTLYTSDSDCATFRWDDDEFATVDGAKAAAQEREDTLTKGDAVKSAGEMLYEAMHGADRPLKHAGNWERSPNQAAYETAAIEFLKAQEP